MDFTTAVVSFAVVAGLLTIIPGVDTALVLRTAVVQGRRHAFATAFGICTGALVWGAAAAAGISVLLTASRTAYTVMRVAGAIYLIYLGVMMLRDARRPKTAADVDVALVSPWRAFARGLTTNLLNPKVGVFYVAMLPQFLPADVPALPMGVLLALVHDLEAMVWFTLIIGGVGLARRWLTGSAAAAVRIRRVTDAIAGTALVALGIRLAAD
ncbi:threonine/homoserine/homoserine lactone efflux protein [Hamadaea flava]|uniref:LysE family translocator n=1 Tax=Hamadaea flava TaxID=1742688 RepID=A0ABV8LTS8_9ACTN|nr:LysE family translocator [Hamadaea flava]MCP2327973.1 threonine/homoserine/homoserine lactone efflux protein [Hamadaea flava]